MDTRRIYRIVSVVSLLVVVFLWTGRALALNTYDNFMSGDLSNWDIPAGSNSDFYTEVHSSSLPQDYVLHVFGKGGVGYPGSAIQTKSSFAGSFGAGINFVNFSYIYSGSAPNSTDAKYPSISLQVGDFGGTSPYFLVSRAFSAYGNIIGWREYGANNTLISSGATSYSGTSGGLAVSYVQQSNGTWLVDLGYFSSANPATWGSSTYHSLLLSPIAVTFNNDPLLRIATNGGLNNNGIVSVDVGGLYYGPLSAVPIPNTLWFFGPGLAGLGLLRKTLRV